jgi:hypothetical protein
MLITAKTVSLDKMTSSGRIYPKKVMEKAIADFKPGIVGYYLPDHESMTDFASAVSADDEAKRMSYVSHTIEGVKIDQGQLIATIKPLDNIMGKMLMAAVRRDDIAFRPSGTGKINKRKEIYEFEMVAINAYDAKIV